MSKCYDSYKLYKPLERGKGFKLQRLPMLARNEVVRSMDIREIIMLSLFSRKIEFMVKYAKVKVNRIDLHINISNSILKIESLDNNWYQCGPDQRKKGSDKTTPPIFSRWIDKNATSFQNCVSMFKRLQNIISFLRHGLHVDFEVMTPQFFKEILTEPALMRFGLLCLDRGKITAECLDLVMKTAHFNRALHIKETKIPEDYYHKDAFLFYDIIYLESKWIRIEQLFSLKNNYTVSLGWSRLTYSDLNTFIKFWIDNDYDMVRVLTSNTRVPIPIEVLFDGMMVFKIQRSWLPIYFVAANPMKKLWIGGKEFHEFWEAEIKILKALNKKKKLEEELREIEKVMLANRDQNMIEKKNDISRDLKDVSSELDGYKLVLVDGVYSYM